MPDEDAVSAMRQRATLSSLALGGFLALLGGILAFAAWKGFEDLGLLLQAAGVLLLTLGLGLSYKSGPYERLRKKLREHGRLREIQEWQTLKVASMLLNLLTLVAIIVVLLAAASRLDLVRVDLQGKALTRIIVLLQAVLGVNLAFAVLQSLRVSPEQDRTGLNKAFHIITLSGLIIAAVGAVFLNRLVPAGDAGVLGTGDSPLLLLVAYTYAGIDAFIGRSLPTLYVLFSEERDVYQGHTYFSRAKSVVAPTMIAFALLFLVFLLFIVFGATVVGAFGTALRQPAFIALVALMVAAVVAAVIIAMRLGRREDRLQVYREEKQGLVGTERIIVVTSLAVALLFFGIAVVLGVGRELFGMDRRHWLDFTSLGLMALLGPYGFYKAHDAKRVRRLEERFPDFLRDLASSHRGGLTLPAAVTVAARGEYGPLTLEIKKMADQMSWNVAFSDAMTRFADRVRTPLIQRAVALIREAGRSGGSTSEVLYAAARDAREIKNMENERRLSMTLYGIIIYITFFVFLVVAAVLFNQFVPQLIASSKALEEAGAQAASFQINSLSEEAYRGFYFSASLVQAVGSGIVAGMMSTGRAILGMRHAFVMVVFAYLAFALFLV